MRLISGVALWAALLALCACSPTFNWRTVQLDTPGAEVLLPCKPDRGVRSVALAGQSLEMSMVGCDAGGATFAVAWAALPGTVLPGDALAHWRSATLANIHAAPAPTAALDAAFIPPGALPLPQAVRILATGQRATGAPVTAQAAWFSHRVGATTYVLHAVVYADHADQADAAVADTFFAGIRFP